MKIIYSLAAMLLLLSSANAQTVPATVRGNIISSTGVPVKGASIILVNSKTKTLSGEDGSFSMFLSVVTDTLIITHVNFREEKIPVNKSMENSLSITLIPSIKQLEEVFINTGYQTLPKERATGSFEKIDNALFNQQAGTTVISRIEALANSVYFERKTSSTPVISIRGLSTIRGPKAPLIILDNFPYEGSLDNINPNDVESITILKDAAAASIWGTRAGNGVIVISTKKGRFNQPIRIQINTNVGITEKPDLFYYKNISSSDFIDVEKFLFSKGFYNSQLTSSFRPPVSPVIESLSRARNGIITQAAADQEINALRNNDVRSDFEKYIYRTSITQQHAINVSGGGNNIAWNFSAGFDRNIGSLNQKYSRINIRTDNTFRLSKKLQLITGVWYTQSRTIAGSPGYNTINTSNGKIPTYTKLADDSGKPLTVIQNYRQAYLDTVGNGRLMNWSYYPLNDYKHINNSTPMQDIVLNTGVMYIINNALTADIKYQYERQESSGRILYDDQSYFTRNLINGFTQIDPLTRNYSFPVPKGPILDIRNGLLQSHQLRGQLNFNKQWGHHKVIAIAGSEIRQALNENNSFRTYGYNDDILTSGMVNYLTQYPHFISGSASSINNGVSFSGRLNRFVSYFTNTAYTFNDKYTFSASARRDASNLFGATINNRWTPLWSAGAAWDISKENFYKFNSLAYLKLRATYGVSGNADPLRSAVTTLNYSLTSRYTLLPAARIEQFNNPGLRWEKVGLLNLGIDFKTSDSRLSGSVEYYFKKGKDLFGSSPVDYTGVAADNIIRNVASIKATGIDIALNSANLKGDFSWTTNFNLSYNKDKVVTYFLSNKTGSNYTNGGTSISAIEGKPVYAIYSYPWAGLNDSTGDPQGFINGNVSRDYSTLLGSTTLISDLLYNGAALPVVFGSMGNTFSYMGLSLTARLIYKFGYWFSRPSLNYNALFNSRDGHSDFADRWQKPGDASITNVPSLVYPNSQSRDNFYRFSEVLVEKGDNVRLQYITLAYDINSNKNKRMPLTNFQLYINVNNIGIIWRANKQGIDPDYSSNSTPPSKNIIIGVRAGF